MFRTIRLTKVLPRRRRTRSIKRQEVPEPRLPLSPTKRDVVLLPCAAGKVRSYNGPVAKRKKRKKRYSSVRSRLPKSGDMETSQEQIWAALRKGDALAKSYPSLCVRRRFFPYRRRLRPKCRMTNTPLGRAPVCPRVRNSRLVLTHGCIEMLRDLAPLDSSKGVCTKHLRGDVSWWLCLPQGLRGSANQTGQTPTRLPGLEVVHLAINLAA